MTYEHMQVTLMQIGDKLNAVEKRLVMIEGRTLTHNEELIAMRKNMAAIKNVLSS
jgi:hypothetical protein